MSSCAAQNKISDIAVQHGFKHELVKGGDFWITTYQKITNTSEPFVFYIEGDGFAFINKRKISPDPTPRSQMMFNLATMDSRPNIIYIARPCQYTPMAMNPKCNYLYWTNKRLSDDSIYSINETINKINHKKKFSLIGFSGGGGVAVLIASRNNITKDILTLAGNLDTENFVKIHKVSEMTGSLNPIDYAKNVKNIPQLHLSGENDTTIPPSIAGNFVDIANSKCVKQKIIKNVSHHDGWEENWHKILTSAKITCN